MLSRWSWTAGRHDSSPVASTTSSPGQVAEDAVPGAQGEPAVELVQHDGRGQRDDRDAEQDLARSGVPFHVDVAGQVGQPVDVVVVGEIAGRAPPGPRQVAQVPEQARRVLGLARGGFVHGPAGRPGPGASSGTAAPPLPTGMVVPRSNTPRASPAKRNR
ncbi:hypothetical protein LUX57_20465 [Actinomadura madurae]|uniref:hypothetical protein n=1 Tax=Actinomadura madurae TaxID=1993 RepID=UPI0020D20A4E|nr:hypothetical protein [Actinomadura madurae]MCP9967195.1 hypothetical protein [Actinomadura madurae]